MELAKPRKHMYGGYPKTSGPPAKEENSLPQADKEDNSLDQDGSVEWICSMKEESLKNTVCLVCERQGSKWFIIVVFVFMLLQL